MAKRKVIPPEYGTPDDDIPEMTLAHFRKARPVKEVFPELIEASERYRARMRGRPRKDSPKQHVSLRLDAKVIAGFKAQGPGWQGRINAALTRALAQTTKRKGRGATTPSTSRG